LFTGDEKIIKYNPPMYSKSETNDVMLSFLNGIINQLCLIKKGSAGIRIKLKTVLITAINSNEKNLEQMLGRSLLTDTEDADIHIL
jgi:hypothetical protein